MKGTFRKLAMASAACATSLIGVVAIGGTSTAGATAAKGTPLVFGEIGTDTTGYAIPEDGQALAAYVANWNAHGGYKGHPIKIVEIDGGLSPTTTSNAARTLVDSDNVIGMVNDYGFLDCTINNSFYQQSNVAALGLGATGCFIKDTDFPFLRTPGSGGLSDIVKFAVDSGSKKVALQGPALFQPEIPGLTTFTKSIGGTLIVPPFTPTVPAAADFDAWIASAKADGADAVLSLTESSTGELLLQQAADENFGPAQGIKYLFGPTEYDPRITNQINGTYVYTYGYPWSSSIPAAQAALSVLKKGKVSVLDGFAQGGYQAGGVLQQVLSMVKGPVTRASFKAACEKATSVTVPLTPGLKANLVNPGSDTVGGFVVKAENGKFVQVGGYEATHD